MANRFGLKGRAGHATVYYTRVHMQIPDRDGPEGMRSSAS